MRNHSLQWLGFLGLMIGVSVAHASVSLPALFTDGMVVQREMPVHVWGKASP